MTASYTQLNRMRIENFLVAAIESAVSKLVDYGWPVVVCGWPEAVSGWPLAIFSTYRRKLGGTRVDPSAGRVSTPCGWLLDPGLAIEHSL